MAVGKCDKERTGSERKLLRTKQREGTNKTEIVGRGSGEGDEDGGRLQGGGECGGVEASEITSRCSERKGMTRGTSKTRQVADIKRKAQNALT
jgi:hypothetical protein